MTSNDTKEIKDALGSLGDAYEKLTSVFDKAQKDLTPEQQKEVDEILKGKDIMKEAEEKLKKMNFNI